MRVREEDIQKMDFRNLYEFYEFMEMPFRLNNVSATFMDLINWMCMPMLDRSVIVFTYDILVYYKTKEKHEDHLREVLETLIRERLYV